MKGKIYLLCLMIFITSVQAGVFFSPDTFSATLYPSETRPFSLFIKNTDSVPSNITLTTVSANASCFLDNGLSFYSFMLSAQSNRTINVFLQIPGDAVQGVQQCTVTKTHTEPDPVPSPPSGGGGSGGSGSYSVPSPVLAQPFCDVPATPSEWSAARIKITLNTTNVKSPYPSEGNFMYRFWTITYANCTTTTFTETKNWVSTAPATTNQPSAAEADTMQDSGGVSAADARKEWWTARAKVYGIIVGVLAGVGIAILLHEKYAGSGGRKQNGEEKDDDGNSAA